ncbi:anti-sigma factor domain-containing protein [uncultured Devosia sp.]|uniref:anti-sigma factor n=1 Tax=uncultured Devosia sp. TaxID=211434 RepID=UPI0035CBEF97
MTRQDRLGMAGDYVLGLMDDVDRLAFERAMAEDAELAGMVAKFAERMQALDTPPPERPSAALWSAIEQRLDAIAPPGTAPAEPAEVVRFERHRPPLPPAGWFAVAASLLVALAVGYFTGNAARTAPEPAIIAVLLDQSDSSPAVIVEAFSDDSVHLVPLQSLAVPEGKILQVWTLPDVATGPVSLGTLQSARDISLAGPSLPMPQAGQLYEITLEPSPGSPTGRPTGPILVKGFAKLPVP